MLYNRLDCQYKDKLESLSDTYPLVYRSILSSLSKNFWTDLTIQEGQDLCQYLLSENLNLGLLQKLFN